MSVAQKSGGTLRDHLEFLAARGNAAAAKDLTPPDYPEEIEYLRDWIYQIHGRSGVGGMGNLAPLSYPTVDAWARLHGLHVEPGDVDALMLLDGAILAERAKHQPKPKPPANSSRRPR